MSHTLGRIPIGCGDASSRGILGCDASPNRFRRAWNFLFSQLLFPDSCRVCETPLVEASRIPVCTACLSSATPLAAEYFCAACQAPFASPYPLDDNNLCGLCRRGMRGFDRCYSYGFYEGTLARLIQLLKYERIEPLAPILGGLLSNCLPRETAFDGIVPMPMHWTRRYLRGFNQAELLARDLSRRTGIPLLDVARRSRLTRAQVGLSDHHRRRNVAGAFSISRPDRLEGRHVLIIDDVLTTGATAAACAGALKKAGAARVTALTVARADRRLGPSVPLGQDKPLRAQSNTAGGC